MKWTIKKEFKFEAAHRLPLHDGKCRRLHGHSFIGYLELSGHHLQRRGPKAGMLVDYGDISAVVKPLLEKYLDHHYLNETLKLKNPTSEEIAKWIYDRLAPRVPRLVAVVIHETCTSSCRYEG